MEHNRVARPQLESVEDKEKHYQKMLQDKDAVIITFGSSGLHLLERLNYVNSRQKSRITEVPTVLILPMEDGVYHAPKKLQTIEHLMIERYKKLESSIRDLFDLPKPKRKK